MFCVCSNLTRIHVHTYITHYICMLYYRCCHYMHAHINDAALSSWHGTQNIICKARQGTQTFGLTMTRYGKARRIDGLTWHDMARFEIPAQWQGKAWTAQCDEMAKHRKTRNLVWHGNDTELRMSSRSLGPLGPWWHGKTRTDRADDMTPQDTDGCTMIQKTRHK